MNAGNKQIQIHRMIIHKIDHKNFDEPQYADLESPLTPEAQQFLIDHIARNQEHKYARSALFLERYEGNFSLRDCCEDLVANPDAFVNHSRAIAKHLFLSVDKRVSTGDLVVCLFADEPNEPWSIALLKMDEKDGFVGERDDIGGQKRYILKRVGNVLPNGYLQKCAFILPIQKRTDRQHLIVLDQQTARFGSKRIAASFFTSQFLQCNVGLNSREKTEAFVWASYDWIDGKKKIWPEEQVERLETRISTALQAQLIDIDDIARNNIANPDEQVEYMRVLREKLQVDGFNELVFQPDASVLTQTEYTVIEGDNDLRIQVRSDSVGDKKTLLVTKDDATNTYVITIRTTAYQRKRKLGRR